MLYRERWVKHRDAEDMNDLTIAYAETQTACYLVAVQLLWPRAERGKTAKGPESL